MLFRKYFLFLLLIFSASLAKSQSSSMLTNDGAWCWFSDPRAIYLPGDSPQIITGWVKKDGSVEVGSYNLQNQKTSAQIIYPKLEIDDHNNPAFVVRPDGHIMAFYTMHHNKDIYMSISSKPKDISNWKAPVTINPNDTTLLAEYINGKYTYANPFILTEENNRIYLFGRWLGFKPNMSWSDDGGTSWATAKVVVSPKPYDPGQRPYVKYYSNGKDKIHMVFTDGHPRNELTNSVYYAYYQNGAFYKADGAKICPVEELPFEPKNATKVYDAVPTKARAWVWDICENEEGNPVIAYTRLPEDTDHRYHYAWYDGKNWQDYEICKASKWFPQTPEGEEERENFYSGGLTLDPNHPATVFLSRPVNGIFEIEQWQTGNGGKKWKSVAITKNSRYDQVRPFVVRDLPKENKTTVLWMENEKYIHYTDYDCNIKAAVDVAVK